MGEYEDPEFKEKQRRRSAPLPSRPPGLYPLTEVAISNFTTYEQKLTESIKKILKKINISSLQVNNFLNKNIQS